jgi:spermidine synthase
MRSSFLFGFLNALVGLVALFMLKREIAWWRGLLAQGVFVLAIITAGFVCADMLMSASERGYYSGETVILSKSTPYQHIVLTRHRDDLRLYLNGNLQFSSRDEYRYHESLVHPVMSRVPAGARVLILGGGDGLALREVLRYPDIAGVTLVDLDPEMTRMFASLPMLAALNNHSLVSPRAEIINADAFTWLEKNRKIFDAAIIDFPDPTSFSLGKLYTTAFYQRLQRALSPGALVVVQTTSPLVARHSFWCVDATLRACGWVTVPYHCYVPSFGEWGFIIASRRPLPATRDVPDGLRFYSGAVFAQECEFPPDMSRVDVEPNKLNNQVLVRLFEREWGKL